MPYTPPPAGALPGATTTTGVAASMAGGSVAGTTQPTVKATPVAGPTLRPLLLVPGSRARYVNGLAAAPMGAPEVIQKIIWAGNELIGLPYIFGGGHASFVSPGYDCSGTVSFALHGAGLLATPEDSSEFEGLGLARDRPLGRGLLQPRSRVHDRRRACAWTRARPTTRPTSRVRAGARCARKTPASSCATPWGSSFAGVG